jgi:putative DNA primase/helicase
MSHLYYNIPAVLKQRRNWVVWGLPNAPPKSPFHPARLLEGKPEPAKAGVRQTWDSYQNAVECVRRGLARGIGYEFDGSLYGVDLDHVIAGDGTLTPEAREIADLLDSYTEISPSGTGLHIFVSAPGANIRRHRKKGGSVEIYSEGRYFTVTGDAYGGVKPIETRRLELQIIHDRFLLPAPAQRPASPSPPPMAAPMDSEASRFLRIGLERDGVFRELWDGGRRHGNESADDQALMNKLAYWCNADSAAMIQAFLSSPHCTRKDESHKRKCQRDDYLPNTAREAAATVYSTALADYERWQENRGRRERSFAR